MRAHEMLQSGVAVLDTAWMQVRARALLRGERQTVPG